MLIISGADLVGKSTLVQRCVELLQERGHSHMAAHLSRVPESWDAHNNYLERLCLNSVWDRFHLDELAYRCHDTRHSTMTPLKWDLVCAAVAQHCGFQVVLFATDDEIRARYAERGDKMYDVEHVLRVNQSFRDVVDCRGRGFLMRGDAYDVPIHLAGSVTGDKCAEMRVTAEWVVDAYLERLEEYLQISCGSVE